MYYHLQSVVLVEDLVVIRVDISINSSGGLVVGELVYFIP
jgi:hypothetical protein